MSRQMALLVEPQTCHPHTNRKAGWHRQAGWRGRTKRRGRTRPPAAFSGSARGFGGNRVLGELADHRLDLEELLQAELSEFAAIA